MLSLKNLVKTYNVKGKVPVRALDGITVDLPETGMVFLLGKSGSGKSTLLNVAGGLDFPTSGELIVDGKSSKYFSQSDYDGYRNAYVGFVFQEYNILEELTVEQNISLALQLQNKPNDKTAVNDILDRVELSGLNKRKPNTLSGGQRQRVAIARALIKNPKIIMADEPTGALDSATGEQIFSVLKELSKNRLILVVSHDKSFAERFGDRIIELSDGKIISDTLVTQTADKPSARNFEVITPETILIRDWSQITQSDFTEMVSLMRKTKSETVITSDKECIYPILNKLDTKKGKPNQAEETKKEAAAVKKSFIKSKLPIKHALKLSLDGIKTKPIRLIFTVLLSIIAFTLFGISTTLMLYEEAYSVSNALADSVYDSVVLNKSYKAYYTQTYLDGREYVKNESSEMLKTAFTQEELDNLNKNEYGLLFAGIMDLGAYDYTADSVGAYQSKRFALDYTLYNEDAYYYCVNSLSGFSDCGEEFLTKNGIFCVVGGYPKDKTEIALPYYIYDYCLHILLSKNVIADANDFPPALLIGQKLGFGGITLTVSGIYNVGNIPDKFNELKNKESQLDFLSKKTMAAELYDYLSNSFHTVAFVSKDFYDAHKYDGARIGNAPSFGIVFSSEPIKSSVSEKDNTSIITPRAIWDYGDLIVYYDKSGNKISVTDLEETDIYLPAQTVYYLAYDFYSQLSSPDCNGEPYDELKTILSKFGYDAYYYEKLSSEEFTTLIEKTFVAYKSYYGTDLPCPEKYYMKNHQGNEVTLNVKGFYNIPSRFIGTQYVISDELRENYAIKINPNGNVSTIYKTDYNLSPKTEKYGKIIALSDHSLNSTRFMLNASQDGAHYSMDNAIYLITVQVTGIIAQMKQLFYVAGVILGVFAALMLFNFISVSISSKKREIGILRAVGANKFDVIKIFFIETMMITFTCFVVSAITGGVACSLLNAYSLENALKIKILHYNAVNVVILFIESLVVSVVSTIFPVLSIAKKPPVVGIREN